VKAAAVAGAKIVLWARPRKKKLSRESRGTYLQFALFTTGLSLWTRTKSRRVWPRKKDVRFLLGAVSVFSVDDWELPHNYSGGSGLPIYLS